MRFIIDYHIFKYFGTIEMVVVAVDGKAGLCSLCWLYEYVHLTPNFHGARGGPVAVARLREEDETEAQEWRNGWSKHLPAVMDGVYDCIGDKEAEVR